MKSKISSKWPLVIVSLVGIVFSLMVILFVIGSQTPQNLFNNKSVASIKSTAFPEQTSSGVPVRLKIPTISVNAAIQYVGVTSDGAMDVPKDPYDVAWYELGPKPGEPGSAVIAGHYGSWKNGAKSVFDDLSKLRKGDKLYVEDDKGVVATFVVSKSRIYDPNANASDVFESNDGKAHLNLITCEGIWDEIQKTYSNRLVVFTDKE